MTEYSVLVGDDEALRFRGNFAQASSPVQIQRGDGTWGSTPFQVADFSHCEFEAARRINRWLRMQGGEAWVRGQKGLTLRTWRKASK